ncbi:MAG: Cell division protein FtsH [uncultured Gemmatimonadetes bacterium]|uniref:ATP-dependent zinc metalloprotease FtsH n=1 Tax=uncultured Gemmatimonadota bacterium TaxID=203437 RepID=A0A6J4KIV4_9BACT|nr:MAG: Cell division protein FtsH [uncultured Gemmatimonadota bacterium]
MAERDNGTPTPPSRWGRATRTATFWAVIVLVSIGLVTLNTSRAVPTAEIDYSQFRAQLASGNVTKAQFVGERELRGTTRTPLQTGRGAAANQFTLLVPPGAAEDLIKEMNAAKVPLGAVKEEMDWGVGLMKALPWLLLIGFWVFIFRQMQSSGNKAFQFGKSKAKLLSGDTPRVTFEDVAGAVEAKFELQEIVEFLKDPKRFSRLGGRIPKGALLVGPPGTGKTLLARAVAGEAGRPFFSMSGSDFVEMFVGVGASRVRDLFEQGKSHAPCIIFIDEIDAVGRHRGAGLGGGHDEREQTLNQLLVEMDGFEGNDGVILIAATNRPDVLDPALLRPGRFDRQVVVDAPDVKGREAILRVHLRKIPTAPDVSVPVLARGTPGMVGADLANLVNEGALLAARRNRDMVFMADLEDAKDKVMLGAERRSLVMREEERRLTAFHEAGHAVCALKIQGNDPLHKLTIVPRGRALGLAFTLPEDDRVSVTRQELEAQLAMCYGGRIAEELVFGRERVTTGASSDIQRATGVARRYVTQWGLSDAVGPVAISENSQEVFLGRDFGQRREVSEKMAELVDAEVGRVLNEALERARATITEHRDLLDRLAISLLERETLGREEIDILVSGQELPPIRPEPTYGPPDLPSAPPLKDRPSIGVEGLKPRLA